MFCELCENFTSVVEDDGKPRILCESCGFTKEQNHIILASSIPLQLESRNVSTEISPESIELIKKLSYNPITPIASDKECPKCKVNCKYMVDYGKTNLFIYACPNCHEYIKRN